MKKKLNIKAFTLIELIVVISVIITITIGVSRINFNNMGSSQKLEIFTNSIITHIETIRNNSLLGKGIGQELNTPEKWRIEFSRSPSNIITKYFDGNDWNNYHNIVFRENYDIKEIRCGTTVINDESLNTGTGSIIFDQINSTIYGDCEDNSNIEIDITNKSNNTTIEFNSLNGLIKVK